ncbi:MAG TPA: hypothetical protein VGZ04_05010 [Acidimicrobiales bacterium]|jgi:hypothetical protein|nr:hypothetical protein [Acidimicrobiales bacterium]
MLVYFGVLEVSTQCSAEVVFPNKTLAGEGHVFTAYNPLRIREDHLDVNARPSRDWVLSVEFRSRISLFLSWRTTIKLVRDFLFSVVLKAAMVESQRLVGRPT